MNDIIRLGLSWRDRGNDFGCAPLCYTVLHDSYVDTILSIALKLTATSIAASSFTVQS